MWKAQARPTTEESPRRPLVFMSTLSAVDRFVLGAVCEAHPNVHLLRLHEVPNPHRRPLWRRVFAHPWRSVKGRVRDAVQGPLFQRMETRIGLALFDTEDLPPVDDLPLAGVTHAYTWEVKGDVFLRRLRALDPARMLICGAPILPPTVCSATSHGAFNIHWGIAPEYRGGNSVFFALREGRSDRVGVTLHDLTPGVDAGDIVGQATVTVMPDDDETSLWVKSAHEAAVLAARLAALPADAALLRRPQGKGGRMYRYADRTLGREFATALRRHVLRVRPEPATGTRSLPRARAEATSVPAA